MTKFNLNLPYNIKFVEGQKITTNKEATVDYISYAVTRKYPEGLEGGKRRIWGRIQRKMDAVVDSPDTDSIIDLENAEVDFIKAAFKDAKFPPNISKYVVVLEDFVDSLGTEEEEKKEG